MWKYIAVKYIWKIMLVYDKVWLLYKSTVTDIATKLLLNDLHRAFEQISMSSEYIFGLNKCIYLVSTWLFT